MLPPPLTVRPPRDEELAAVAALWWASFRSTGLPAHGEQDADALLDRLRTEMADGWRVTIALRDDMPIAMMATRRGVLEQLFVAPDAQGKGVGHTLFREAAHAMPGGFSFHTHADNRRARRFYERERCILDHLGRHARHGYPVAHYRWTP